MERISTTTNHESSDSMEYPSPPPYASIVYKMNHPDVDTNPPPMYTDLEGQSVVYINNYPGPPLTDGCVHIVQNNEPVNHEDSLPNRIITYLIVNGILLILLGFACVGVQIGIIAAHSIFYYYYGFWSGAFLISIGINTLALFRYRRGVNYTKLVHTFFWQMVLITIIFGIGIALLATEKCDSNEMQSEDATEDCRSTDKTLNGSLFGIIAVAFVQSILSAMYFYTFKKRHALMSSLTA